MTNSLKTTLKNELQTFKDVNQETVWFENLGVFNTQDTYKEGIKQFLDFIGAKSVEDLREIENIHVIRFRDYLTTSGKTDATVNNRLSAISSLFNFLIEKQIVKFNPTLGVKRKPVNHTTVKSKCLSKDEVTRLIKEPDISTAIGLRDRAILSIFSYSGCRISELCKLKVKDFYMDNDYPVLRFIIKGGKEHVVAINQECANHIKEYLKTEGHSVDFNSHLFLKYSRNKDLNTKTPLTRRNVSLVWQKYAKKIGRFDGSPHSSRTTLATHAHENPNIKLSHIQHTLGHTSIRTTQKYTKIVEDHKNSASFAVRY